MSSPNLELVRSIYAAWERGDFSDSSWADPEIEFLIDDGVSVTRRKGLAAMAEAWRNFLLDWEHWEAHVEEYRELGDGRVLALLRARGRGRTSGVDLGALEKLGGTGANVFQIRDGRVTKLDVYLGRERALVEAGVAVTKPSTSDNVDLVRRARKAWSAGDFDALREFYDPHIVVRGVDDWPEPGPFVGPDAVIRQWQQLRATSDELALTAVSDYIEVGNRVAIRQIWHMTGHGPDNDVEQTLVFTIRDGKIVSLDFFWDHSEALATMGLSQAGDAPVVRARPAV